MVVSYHGGQFIRVTFGDTTVAFDPVSKESKLPKTRFGADVALVSLNHPDMNGIEQVTHGERAPFVIDGPGEYEVKKMIVAGVLSESEYGTEKRLNTMYRVTIDGTNLVFLGALSERKLSPSARAALDGVDVLFVPIGGEGVLDASEAHELSVELEPHIVIPIHYGLLGTKDALKSFLKEEGAEEMKPVEKFTFKRKDIESEEGRVVVLA